MKKATIWTLLATLLAACVMLACHSLHSTGSTTHADDDQSPAADDDNDDDDDNDASPTDDDDDASPTDDDDDASPTCETVTRGSLEWSQCDNGADIDQPDAVAWAANLNLGGHTDWRLPTRAELQPLFDPTQSLVTACYLTVHIAQPFFLTCKWVWTSEVWQQEQDIAWIFDFGSGTSTIYDKNTSDNKRALAVRDI